MLRRDEMYLDPDTEIEKHKLVSDGDYDEESIGSTFRKFYGIFYIIYHRIRLSFKQRHFSDNFTVDANDYLDEWTEQFAELKVFSWITLRHFPSWLVIKSAMDNVAEKTSFNLAQNSSKVFDLYGYMKSYCTDEKIAEWRNNKVPTDARWVDIFKHLEREQLPYYEFALIVEFILCLPGSSAPVERIFSNAKQMWKNESSALLVKTLNAMLKVKVNMEYNCIEFYNFLKTQPMLLKQISGLEKYGVSCKDLTDDDGAGASPMSVVVSSDED